MVAVYNIDSTDGSTSITLKPGALNGPGSAQRDSDLRLYGMGALQWGEGMDENVYRLAETFSCPAKELGDYNPDGGANDYNPATDPVLPKDDNDLGPGLGIVTPLNGQQWYNSTKKAVFVYDTDAGGLPIPDPKWLLSSGTTVGLPPLNPNIGDVWYDTSNTTSDPNGCILDPLLKIYDPTHSEAGIDGFVIVGENFVRQCGDWMSGVLDMGGSDSGATARYNIINVEDPVDPYDAVNKQYTDSIGGSLNIHAADFDLHLSPEQNAYLDALNLPALTGAESNYNIGVTSPIQAQLDDKVDLSGDTMTGFLTLNANPTAPLHAATKQWVESETLSAFVELTGDTMTGFLTLNANPTNPLHAVTKQYVDGNASDLVGFVLPFANSSVPTGYLKCNGATANRTTYANLFAAIGTLYGNGNGSTTFNLPDLRGEFIRGWDNARGVDAGRGIGTFQSDLFKSHTHSQHNLFAPAPGVDAGFGARDNTATTGATGGSETRPRNIAMLYCIKY